MGWDEDVGTGEGDFDGGAVVGCGAEVVEGEGERAVVGVAVGEAVAGEVGAVVGVRGVIGVGVGADVGVGGGVGAGVGVGVGEGVTLMVAVLDWDVSFRLSVTLR